MNKVRSPKQIKVKRKMDVSRPSYSSGAFKNKKSTITKLPGRIGSTLDNLEIEEIKLE